MELTGGLGVDVAIEAVGVPETFELCTELDPARRPRANVGVHGHPATLHLEKLWIRDVTITTGLVDTTTTPKLLKLIQERPPRPDRVRDASVLARRYRAGLRHVRGGSRDARAEGRSHRRARAGAAGGCRGGRARRRLRKASGGSAGERSRPNDCARKAPWRRCSPAPTGMRPFTRRVFARRVGGAVLGAPFLSLLDGVALARPPVAQSPPLEQHLDPGVRITHRQRRRDRRAAALPRDRHRPADRRVPAATLLAARDELRLALRPHRGGTRRRAAAACS